MRMHEDALALSLSTAGLSLFAPSWYSQHQWNKRPGTWRMALFITLRQDLPSSLFLNPYNPTETTHYSLVIIRAIWDILFNKRIYLKTIWWKETFFFLAFLIYLFVNNFINKYSLKMCLVLSKSNLASFWIFMVNFSSHGNRNDKI